MPLYEFLCSDCGQEFEELVFKAAETVNCPGCSSANARKLISACKFKTGGPVVQGSPSANAITTRGSGCGGCAGGNCSSC
ncbi:zinc ribbon domain-containing protein [Desulfonatronospira sp.]|uniref:FmdB family zinc ribbon protein n=1 Tax=Desulfonatronospira sp. TaxID=1962951 RepID=UPI0025BB89BE|nr:zinc ribbon domain-containing protein [Desulfonatronospira sp.]